MIISSHILRFFIFLPGDNLKKWELTPMFPRCFTFWLLRSAADYFTALEGSSVPPFGIVRSGYFSHD